jgi:hypothetical protein
MKLLRAVEFNYSVAISLFNVFAVVLQDESGGNIVDISANCVSDLHLHDSSAAEGLAVESGSEQSRSGRVQVSVIAKLIEPFEDNFFSLVVHLLDKPLLKALNCETGFSRVIFS